MSLDPKINEDMQKNATAVRARMGLEFYLLPPKKTTDCPWIMVDKATKLRPRIMDAKRALRDDSKLRQKFFMDKVVTGRLEVIARKLVFVADKPPDFDIETMMQTKWSVSLKQEGGEVEKFAILLRKAVFKDEAAAMKMAESEESETYDGALSPQQLDEIFGPDGEAAAGAMPKLSDVNERLKGLQRTSDTESVQTDNLLEKVLGVSGPDLGNALHEQVGQFLKFVVAELPVSSTELSEEEELQASDKILHLASQVNAYVRCLLVWEQRLDSALDAKAYVDEATKAGSTRTPEEEEDFQEMLAQYESARRGALAAQARADELMSELEGSHEAVKGTI